MLTALRRLKRASLPLGVCLPPEHLTSHTALSDGSIVLMEPAAPNLGA